MVAPSRMAMTPTWLAIREAARRWLRAIEVKIHGSQPLLGCLDGIGPRIADYNPRIVQNVAIMASDDKDVFEAWLDGQFLLRFGGGEPDENICWVMDSDPARVQEFAITLLDLASAGYPGCASCGGSDDGSWDELLSRGHQVDEAGNGS